jgi:GDPmannose 4,6-dehydratase
MSGIPKIFCLKMTAKFSIDHRGRVHMPRALITGVSGQDGYYLSKLLLDKGYEVFGLVRRISKPAQVLEGVKVIHGDVTDQGSINRAILEAMPDEVYNLAAQSFVGASWDAPVSTVDITGVGALRVLEALRQFNPRVKYYQASSSEMFGNQSGMLNEQSAFKPRSPYGCAKVLAHNLAVNYRESYGMFTACGILFNHESPKRGKEFVTQKIIQAAKNGDVVKLGNVEARRDWGYAKEYVEAMWLMLQQDEPDDFVIATGVSHTIQEFCELAEVEYEIDQSLYRPVDILDLRGDASKAKRVLGWEAKVDLKELVRIMRYENS